MLSRSSFLRASVALVFVPKLPSWLPTGPTPTREPLPWDTATAEEIRNDFLSLREATNRPIPFGPRPPINPAVGDRWWCLGARDYEVTVFDGHSWKPVR